jgi:glutamate dehydrogenase
VRAHNAAREIFGLPVLWAQIRSLDGLVPTTLQFELFLEVRRVVERASRWILRNRPHPLDVAATVAIFSPGVPELAGQLPELLTDDAALALAQTVDRWVDAGVPAQLAGQVAALPATLAALDITQVADAARCPLAHAAATHFELDAQLRLDWLRQRILELPREDRWEALARGALRDTLYAVHASLAADVLATGEPGSSGQDQVRRWLGRTEATTSRCVRILDEVAGTGRADLATLTVAVREIGALAQATEHLTPPPVSPERARSS